MIISVECSEGSDCGTPVIKRNGEWSDAEDNKDAIEIVRPEDPDYPEGIPPGERAKQVFRVIANACWGDDPRPGAKVANLLDCLPIGYPDQGFAMIGVDNDRDGQIHFSSIFDRASKGRPYRFWINNDNDSVSSSNIDHPETGEPDHGDGRIQSNRDLEDFTRLQLRVLGYLDGLQAGTIKATLKFRPGTVTGDPAINLWLHRDEDGGLGYLDDEASATKHLILRLPGRVTATDGYTFETSFWTGIEGLYPTISAIDPVRYLLFEGAGDGTGELIVEFRSGDEVLGWGSSCWIDLMDVRSMYLRATALPVGPIIPDPNLWLFEPPPLIPMIPVWNQLDYPYHPNRFEDAIHRRCIVFVHGWRQTPRAAQSYGITMFKRLWWAGYKGRFAVFGWPTYYVETGLDNVYAEDFEAYNSKYSQSEYRAWKSGMALMLYLRALQGKEAPKSLASLDGLQGLFNLADLFGGYSVNLVAHSMGNVVVASALEMGLTGIDNYALLHAAIPAVYYDTRDLLKQAPRDQRYESQTILAFNYRAWDFEPIGEDPVAAIAALGYKGWGSDVPGRLINFAQANDFATRDSWELHNSVGKPWHNGIFKTEVNKTIYYEYNREAPVNEKVMLKGVLPFPSFGIIPSIIPIFRPVTNSHEAMALVAQSKTKTVGAEPRTRGGIDGTVELGDGTVHDFGREHSAEFTRDIQQVRAFYDELLIQFGFKERD